MPGPREQEVATGNALETAVKHNTAQRISGTVATVSDTKAGAIGVTAGQNLLQSTVADRATDSPEVAALSWLVTFSFQGIKKSPRIDQNRDQWWILPALAFLIGFAVWALLSDGNFAVAIAKAIQNAGIMAVGAATNYKTIKPMGILSPADDPNNQE